MMMIYKNYAPFLKDHIEIIKNEISSSVKVNFSNVEISPVKIFSFCSEKKLKMYARKASSLDKNCVKLEDIEFFRDNKKTEYLNEAILNITNNKLLFKNKTMISKHIYLNKITKKNIFFIYFSFLVLCIWAFFVRL